MDTQQNLYKTLHQAALDQSEKSAGEKSKLAILVHELIDTNHFILYVVPRDGQTTHTATFNNGARSIVFPAGFSIVSAVGNFFRFVKPTTDGSRKYRLYSRSKNAPSVNKTIDIVQTITENFTSDELTHMQNRLPAYRIFNTELTNLPAMELVAHKKRRRTVYKTKIGGINESIAEIKQTNAILQSKVERMEKMVETLYKAATGEDYQAPQMAEEIDDLL
jgi:hypothetical protein